MSIKEIKSGTLYKEYSLEIPYEEINEIIDSKIQELLPTVSLPGFRKGKAPLSIVRKKYENNVLSEAVENLVQSKTKDLLEKRNLKPFTQPKIDLKKYEKNEPIEVEIKIDLEPKIKLKDFKSFVVNKYEIDLDKSLIEENYKEFVKSQKKYSKIINNREIIVSDKVFVNLTTNDSSAPDYLKLQKNLPIIIDSEYQVLPEIGSRILEKKLKKGNKDNLLLDVSKSLKLDKEKLILFDVEIIEIEESTPFVVDKEFLDKSGFKDEKDLKNNLEKNFKSQYENGLKQIEKKELMDTLDKEHKFDLPQGILDQEIKDIWHRLEHAKKDGSLDEDDKKLNDEELKKRYEKISKRRVKLALLLQFISKQNNISVDEKELSNGMMQYSSQYPGQEKEIIEYFKKNPSAIETIRGPILEEKVIKSIMSDANIKKIKVTKDEYEKLEKKVFDVKEGN
ncbi:MAG: trigger factor [Pelagibacteraceae bacterium]|nr:trigger factor [Pelagibacteraceae bacterium]